MTNRIAAQDRRWIALALLCVAQFVVVLDASIVNVALPTIGRALKFTESDLPWVVNAYVLTFGGFLLLGGRVADLLGRRVVFMSGLVLFALASPAGGVATGSRPLLPPPALAGPGAALLSPPAPSVPAPTLPPRPRPHKAPGRRGGGGRRGRADRRVRRDRAPLAQSARPLPHLPAAHAQGSQRGRTAGRRLAVLDVLLHLLVYAAGAGLQPDQGGAVVPAPGRLDHRVG